MMTMFAETTGPSLESILEDPTSELFKEFTMYLNQSYCIENLEFWLATQEYYTRIDQLEELGEAMINLYIKPNSPQEINIPCDMRQAILELYKQRNFKLDLFDDAAEAVLELMRVNSFLPWIQHKYIMNHSPSTNSLSSLSDKWNLKRLKQHSRRSCSSLDYVGYSLENSVNSVTRYKTMLKRVKNSLLGQSTDNRKSNDIFYTPRSSLSDATISFTWKRSQR